MEQCSTTRMGNFKVQNNQPLKRTIKFEDIQVVDVPEEEVSQAPIRRVERQARVDRVLHQEGRSRRVLRTRGRSPREQGGGTCKLGKRG